MTTGIPAMHGIGEAMEVGGKDTASSHCILTAKQDG
jgi:hypothetical protein